MEDYMLELNQLEQLVTIEKCQTLSKAAEKLHISQPALSRSMQKLEEDLDISLFTRHRNKIEFNEDGYLALEHAKKIISAADEMKQALAYAAKSRHTISIGSCAPAPLWYIAPEISRMYSDYSILSEMNSFEELEEGLADNKYQIIITTDDSFSEGIICRKYCNENLYVSLPPAHPLASRKELSLGDLNGQSVLLYSQVGFWADICKKKMPDSLFLTQDDVTALNELRKSSALPAFATNITVGSPRDENRVLVPLTDSEVNVTFFLKYKKTYDRMFKALIAVAPCL